VSHPGLIIGTIFDDELGNTVVPFASARVNISIKLGVSNRLGVKAVVTGGVIITRGIILERRDGMSKDLIVHCLATSSRSDKHETVTHLTGVIELDNLHHEVVCGDQFVVVDGFSKGNVEISIVNLWLTNSRE